MSEEKEVADIVSIIEGKCSACALAMHDATVHIFACHKHGICENCYVTLWKTNPNLPCVKCKHKADENIEQVIPGSGNLESFIQSVQRKTQGLVDFRKGVMEKKRLKAPVKSNWIWESQDEDVLAFSNNGNETGILLFDIQGNSSVKCPIPGVRLLTAGMTVSPYATALIAHSKFGESRQLAIYDVNKLSSKNEPLLRRLFHPLFPEKSRALFQYDDAKFGVYCCSDRPHIELMTRDSFSRSKTINIDANYVPHDQDTILTGKDGKIYVASFESDCILVLDKEGIHASTIGKRGGLCLDLPGHLWGPVGILEDSNGNILIGNNDCSLQLYSDENWSLIKPSEDRGTFMSSILFSSKYMFMMYGPRKMESDTLVVYKTIV